LPVVGVSVDQIAVGACRPGGHLVTIRIYGSLECVVAVGHTVMVHGLLSRVTSGTVNDDFKLKHSTGISFILTRITITAVIALVANPWQYIQIST